MNKFACGVVAIFGLAIAGCASATPSASTNSSTPATTVTVTVTATPKPHHPHHHAAPTISTPAANTAASNSCGLTVGADGSAGPVTCPDGHLNQAAVSYYGSRDIGENLWNLAGSQPSAQALNGAICNDLAENATIVEEETILQGLSTAYGWQVGPNPANDPQDGNCG